MFAAQDLRKRVIRDTLKLLGDWSLATENLLLGTAAQESGLGDNLQSGRLRGLYHISAQTHVAVWDKYLINYPDMASRVRGLAGQRSFLGNPHRELVTNLSYTTAIAWLVYKRCNQPLPEAGDIKGLAKYWHQHFRARTTATTADFEANYRLLIPQATVKSIAA